MRKVFSVSIGLFLGAVSFGPAQAEVLPVDGIYPAGIDAAIPVERIAIESFDGDSGTALSFAITDALQAVVIDGQPWFQVVPSTGGAAGSIYIIESDHKGGGSARTVEVDPGFDAVLRGTASYSVSDVRVDDRKRTKCVRKDDKGKCVEEKVTLIECRSMTVNFNPNIRLIGTDGALIHQDRASDSRSQKFCADDYNQPTVESLLDPMIAGFAQRVRDALAPRQLGQQIRVLESRKNMASGAKGPFRDAVRLTKSDPLGACMAFKALETVDPENTSILFNIGLCFEGEGELDTAADYYRHALEVDPGTSYATDGLTRISDRFRAFDQLQLRDNSRAEE